ncbi:MAG TPA: NAD-dependent epimerase/dehydratase family protein [Anaerolineaceae bacterium]|nr:NAD-dependent epimerase/dehydratase family protein [Anaerolineaceae bacterium]
MNILVTGATGFIGSQLCRALVARGHTVRAFHRPTSSLQLLEGLPVERVTGDLTRPETLAPGLQGVQVVFHAAALMGGSEQPGRAYAVTVEGTRALLAAARQAGVERVVHTSSVASLGQPVGGMLLTEDSTWNLPADRWTYGFAKYLAELEVQKAVAQGQDVVIVNPTYVFGPGDLHRQTSSLVVLSARGRMPVLVEGGLNAVHIDDVIDGHLAALERGRTGERYILGGENLTLEQLAGKLAEVTGAQPPVVVLPGGVMRGLTPLARLVEPLLGLPVPAGLLSMAGSHYWVDLTKSQRALGMSPPRPVCAAIQAAYDWFVAVGAIRRSRSSSG